MTRADPQTYIKSAGTLLQRVRRESLVDLWMGVVRFPASAVTEMGRALSQAIFSLAAGDAVNERRTTSS